MSWQNGQQSIGILMEMMAAAMGTTAARQTLAVAEAALKQGLEAWGQVPGDIDWMAFNAGVSRFTGLRDDRITGVRDWPEVARAGRVALLEAGGVGPVVVLVPSLINKGYVLDLLPGFSVVEALVGAGFRVMVVDWGIPVISDQSSVISKPGLGLAEVVVGHLVPLLQKAAEVHGGAVGVLGYCMGGTLSVAAASLLGDGVIAKLALAAVPWDFSQTASAAHAKQSRAVLEPWLGGQTLVPPEVLQRYFWLLDPWSPVRRLMAFGKEADPARVAHMVAIERWLWDGLPMDGPVAAQMMRGWYDENLPMRGEWRIGGEVISPMALRMPVWLAVPQRDVLVPPASSLALLGQVRGAQVVSCATGHVGLVCGRRAKDEFYQPLARWLGGS